MNEPQVLLKTHHYLRSHGLSQRSVSRMFTDAHPTLLPISELEPFQRFFLQVGDLTFHPDLVGQLDDGETLFAVEAKGDTDLLRGLAQAEMYLTGFHQSFLAADAAALGTSWVEVARRKNVGVVAVGDSVTIAYLPEARMPFRDAFRFISRQLDGAAQVSEGGTFPLNLPTHYLVWSIVLEPDVAYHVPTLPDRLQAYPMPGSWRGALRGAEKLGLVKIEGERCMLTEVGAAMKVFLPPTITDWAQVHAALTTRRDTTLAECQPQAAAALRILLLQDSRAQLIVTGLHLFPDHTANFAQLAVACDQLDHARSPVFFLTPKAAAALTDVHGRTHWQRAIGEDYRSTTFYQYKSLLKHSGILKNTGLGSQSAKHYDPERDIWALY